MKAENVATLTRALEIAQAIDDSTECPDPGEGGCMGGPIRGVGCVNEGARAIVRRIRDVLKSES